jgi:hypothetical protein
MVGVIIVSDASCGGLPAGVAGRDHIQTQASALNIGSGLSQGINSNFLFQFAWR